MKTYRFPRALFFSLLIGIALDADAAAPKTPVDVNAQAHEFEARLSQEAFSRFDLHFEGVENEDQAWRAVNILNQAYDELGSLFGQFPPSRIHVYLFGKREFNHVWTGATWRAGFFDPVDGKIRVVVDDAAVHDAEFRRVVRHEFTHAFFFKLHPRRESGWFEEGTAEFYGLYESTDSFWEQNTLETIQKRLRYSGWLTLKDVDKIFRNRDRASANYVYQAYFQAQALVLQTARERGDSWIPSVLERLKSGASLEAAYQDVIGKSPDEAMAQLGESWRK